MIGLGALTGGSSLLESGAEKLGARALGEGLAGRLASHALSGAVEGAYLGGADAVSEDALSKGDHQLTAEKVFSSMAENGLCGAALGAGGSLAGELVGGMGKRGLGSLLERTPSAESVEKVAESQFGYVPEGLGKALVKIQSALAGGGEDIISEAGVQNQSAAAKELRSTLLNIDAEREEATRAVTDHVNTLLQDGEGHRRRGEGRMKRAHLEAR